jgi:hypothetical protein
VPAAACAVAVSTVPVTALRHAHPSTQILLSYWTMPRALCPAVRAVPAVQNPKVTADRAFNGFGTNFEGSPEPIYGQLFLPRKFKVAVTGEWGLAKGLLGGWMSGWVPGSAVGVPRWVGCPGVPGAFMAAASVAAWCVTPACDSPSCCTLSAALHHKGKAERPAMLWYYTALSFRSARRPRAAAPHC